MRLIFRPLLYTLTAYTLYIAGLARVGLVGPDEPRYADVARGMLRLGDYVTPHLFGVPWFEKPPLYYWLTSLTFRLGVNEMTARLPSAMAAILFLGLWYWFARRFYGEMAAKLSCLMLASTVGWIGFARAAAMDMLLTTTLSGGLVLLCLWLWEDRKAGLYGFYALLGLATLAKGPLAVGLAGMILLGYVIHRREWKLISGMLFSPAVFVFAAISFPWYVLCYWRNGFTFIDEFFIRHNIERLVSAESIGHPQPFWFYFLVLPAAVFPWSPALLLPLWDGWKRGWKSLTVSREHVLLIYWVALPFVFFSLAENKLPGYLLPILPPLTLWIGHAVSRQCQRASPGNSLARAALGLSALLILLTPVIAALLPESLSRGLGRALAAASGSGLRQQIVNGPVPLSAWLVLLGLALLSLILLWRGRLLGGAFTGVLGVAWVVLLLTTYYSPAINRVASVRTLAQRIQSHEIRKGELAAFYLHRNQVYGLGFYLEGLPPEWLPESPAPFIRYVAAREDIAVEELHPGARSLSLFPGQQLRLWALSTLPGVEPESTGDLAPDPDGQPAK